MSAGKWAAKSVQSDNGLTGALVHSHDDVSSAGLSGATLIIALFFVVPVSSDACLNCISFIHEAIFGAVFIKQDCFSGGRKEYVKVIKTK